MATRKNSGSTPVRPNQSTPTPISPLLLALKGAALPPFDPCPDWYPEIPEGAFDAGLGRVLAEEATLWPNYERPGYRTQVESSFLFARMVTVTAGAFRSGAPAEDPAALLRLDAARVFRAGWIMGHEDEQIRDFQRGESEKQRTKGTVQELADLFQKINMVHFSSEELTENGYWTAEQVEEARKLERKRMIDDGEISADMYDPEDLPNSARPETTEPLTLLDHALRGDIFHTDDPSTEFMLPIPSGALDLGVTRVVALTEGRDGAELLQKQMADVDESAPIMRHVSHLLTVLEANDMKEARIWIRELCARCFIGGFLQGDDARQRHELRLSSTTLEEVQGGAMVEEDQKKACLQGPADYLFAKSFREDYLDARRLPFVSGEEGVESYWDVRPDGELGAASDRGRRYAAALFLHLARTRMGDDLCLGRIAEAMQRSPNSHYTQTEFWFYLQRLLHLYGRHVSEAQVVADVEACIKEGHEADEPDEPTAA